MDASFASRYGELETWHWWFRGRERVIGRVLERELGGADDLRPMPGGAHRILSLGSGPPRGLSWLTRFLASDGFVVGVDADPAGVLRRGGRASSAPHFVVGHFESPPVQDGSCDVVLALDVLEHVADDVGCLGQAARLTASGGLLMVSVPALPSLWGPQDVVSHHLRRYTRRALLALFRGARLPEPRWSFFNVLLFPPVAALRWARRLRKSEPKPRSDFEANRPGVVNELLFRVFALERHLITRVPFPAGVSLLAWTRVP